ncbi:MAG: 3-oxoacyl-[acyl-carrier-protein] reductase [Geminicoccaceae bacterium]|nr:3-oxoacyl-[acyl-carrier-protein] reductase [Geminicoccaceae bacterium]
MFDLSGKVALVTGASGGIGAAVAETLHRAGAHVLLAGRRTEPLGVLAKKLGDRSGVVVGDVTDSGFVDGAIEAAEKAGGLSILVNNAGLTRDQLAMRMKDEDWQTVQETNLFSAFRLSRAALKGMMKRRSGRIVAITSVVGVTGNPGQSNYAASKAGLIGMSKSLAQEVASRGITVNCVAPGFIDTAMTGGLAEKQKEQLLQRIPAGRLGRAADVAAAVLYLASDEAGYVTGQTLHVNGGMAMI